MGKMVSPEFFLPLLRSYMWKQIWSKEQSYIKKQDVLKEMFEEFVVLGAN